MDPTRFSAYPPKPFTQHNPEFSPFSPKVAAAAVPPTALPDSVQAFIKANRRSDAFIKGKYKGRTFEEVYAGDMQYIVYLIEDCTIQSMQKDRANVVAWLHAKLTHQA